MRQLEREMAVPIEPEPEPEPETRNPLMGNNTFLRNKAGSYGGAIYISELFSETISLGSYVNFTNNEAGKMGGALAVGIFHSAGEILNEAWFENK